MKRFVFCFAFTAALSYTNSSHNMQVARPFAQATSCFFNEPSFVRALRLAAAPFLTTRLSTPTGAANGANPMPIIVPAWWSTPNSNGKIGMSLATASAIATAFAIFVIWYIHDEYRKKNSTTRKLGGAVINTGFTTVKRCLYVMGNALLFGLAFWGLESCFLYGLEKFFQISVNNPQLYNILLTVLAASFYVMITEVVKEKWKKQKRITISTPRDTTPKGDSVFTHKFPGQMPAPFDRFINGTCNDSAFDAINKAILVVGAPGTKKTILLHDVQEKATSLDLPCHQLILANCNLKGSARTCIEKAVNNLIDDARERGSNRGILLIYDIDRAHNDFLAQDLAQYMREYAFMREGSPDKAKMVNVIVIASATRTDKLKEKDLLQEFEQYELQSQQALARQNGANALDFQSLHAKADAEISQNADSGFDRTISSSSNAVPSSEAISLSSSLLPSASASSSSSRLATTPSISASELLRADSVFDRTISSSSSAVSSSEAIELSSPLLSSANAVSSSSALNSNS